MNDVEVLESRLRDALARRAEATTVHAPPAAPLARAAGVAGGPVRPGAWPRAGRRALRVAVTLVVAAGVAGVAGVALSLRGAPDEVGTGDRPPATDGPQATPTTAVEVVAGPIVEYRATALPDGYREVDRDDVPGDVGAEVGTAASTVGTNCLDWSDDGAQVTCERYLAVRNHHYGVPGDPRAVTVTTVLGLSADTLGATGGEPVDVRGRAARLDVAPAPGGTTRLVWSPASGTIVVLTALDPLVPVADLLTLAEGLRPIDVAPPSDLPLVVAFDEVTVDAGIAEVLVWARPGAEPCLGGLIGPSLVVECRPAALGPGNPLFSMGNRAGPAIAGGVSEEVARVVVETPAGPIEADLVAARRPFDGERFFLVPVPPGEATAVVALAPDGSELARHALTPP